MLPANIVQNMEKAGVVAVLTVDDAQDAVPVARALHAGGVSVIELTFRTAAAQESIRRIRAEVPEVVVGAGTLLNRAQVADALKAGAFFGVAPGCNPATLQAAKEIGLPFAPGVMTPSDVEIALTHDCRVLKFFPAETSGGLNHLKTMSAPFNHLGVRYLPLGGVSAANLKDYLSSPLVLGVGGSWLAPVDLIRKKDWAAIQQRATEASQIVRAVRP